MIADPAKFGNEAMRNNGMETLTNVAQTINIILGLFGDAFQSVNLYAGIPA